jgi:deaminated glutathione amidase
VSTRKIRVAVAQLESGDDVESNLVACETQIRAAQGEGARLLVLPENFAYFGSESGRAQIAEDVDKASGPILTRLRESARRYGIALIGGGMPERSADATRPYNTSVLIDDAGGVLAVYRKLHLFDVELLGERYAESGCTVAGDEVCVADSCGLTLGLSICYDIRFPLLYRRLVELGANVLVVSAAFTEQTGRAHWEVLLRARAIESQCWVLASAQCGEHPRERRTFGHSAIIDPWGQVVASRASGVGCVVADVDLDLLDDVRARLPSLRHARSL